MKKLVTRHDAQGSGDYRSRRGSRRHKGRDYLVIPGQSVSSPITGTLERIAYPYHGTKEYAGCVVQGKQIRIKMFYMQPILPIGTHVRRGETIGIAQDISRRYPSDDRTKCMKPHIHIEIESMDPDLLYALANICSAAAKIEI